MNTPRIPQFLTDLSKWLSRCLRRTGKTQDGLNHAQRRRHNRAKGCIQQKHNHIERDRMLRLIRQDARKATSYEEAVHTGYRAKIQRVRLGKGKNTLAGIRFSEA